MKKYLEILTMPVYCCQIESADVYIDPNNETIKSIKEKVAQKYGFYVEDISICVGGKQYDDDVKYDSYTTKFNVILNNKVFMRREVNVFEGESFTLDVREDEIVLPLKKRIGQLKLWKLKSFGLFLNGRALLDDNEHVSIVNDGDLEVKMIPQNEVSDEKTPAITNPVCASSDVNQKPLKSLLKQALEQSTQGNLQYVKGSKILRRLGKKKRKRKKPPPTIPKRDYPLDYKPPQRPVFAKHDFVVINLKCVCCFSKTQCKVEICQATTVWQLKAKIFEIKGINPTKQRIFHCCKELTDKMILVHQIRNPEVTLVIKHDKNVVW
jgi:hypothetical protein